MSSDAGGDPDAQGSPGPFPELDVGWLRAMAIAVSKASAAEVVLELTVSAVHKQPFGLVHGGVYSGLVETGGSIGAQLAAGRGSVVGTENHTSFLRPVREGRLRSISTPLHVGRTTQLWQTTVYDQANRAVALGQLRVLCLPPT